MWLVGGGGSCANITARDLRRAARDVGWVRKSNRDICAQCKANDQATRQGELA